MEYQQTLEFVFLSFLYRGLRLQAGEWFFKDRPRLDTYGSDCLRRSFRALKQTPQTAKPEKEPQSRQDKKNSGEPQNLSE